jgi:hypothetical protein
MLRRSGLDVKTSFTLRCVSYDVYYPLFSSAY